MKTRVRDGLKAGRNGLQAVRNGLKAVPYMIAAVAVVAAAAQTMRTIDKGVQSNMDDASQVVARTPAEWEQLWTRHAGARTRPEVDFSKEMVAAVFLGSRPTAGFGVDIVGVRQEAGTTVIEYRETRPSRDTMTAQVITSPYAIVAIPKTEGAVTFAKVEK